MDSERAILLLSSDQGQALDVRGVVWGGKLGAMPSGWACFVARWRDCGLFGLIRGEIFEGLLGGD